MNLLKISLLACCLLTGINLHAQETKAATLLNYNWENNRNRYQLTPEEEQIPQIVLFSKSVEEYTFEKDDFILYSLNHMIIRVNTDEAIEGSNKIEISMYNTIDVINIKARSISKDGKVIELDKNNIKEIKNEDSNGSSKIFAIEGVEKGSEIEYFYVKKCHPAMYGSKYFQYSAPVREEIFEVIAPEHLGFKFKGYNKFPQVTDTVTDGKKIYHASAKNIPELKEEVYANYQKNRMYVEYKLAYNLAKGIKEINSWADLAQGQYPALNTLTGKETKAVEKLYNNLKIKKDASDEEKVHAVENYVKSNISIQDVFEDDYFSLDRIIQNKYGNKRGLVKLYIALLKQAKVDFQLVITSERSNIPFDGSFESYRFLNNYLFYITSTDKYFTPEESNYRYPLIPYELTYTDGLFLKEMTIGDYSSYIHSVKFIPPMDYTTTHQKIDAEIEFTPGLQESLLKLTNTMKGYYAVYVQPYYSMMPDDKKQKMLEELMNDLTKDTKYTTLTARNTDPNSTLDQPFIVHAEVKGSALIEKAGNKTLFKVGEIIGRQMELYQDKQRKMSVEYDNNREYIRNIKIKIPEGYTVKNLKDININHTYEKDGEKIFFFNSSYEVKDNLITITIDECYRQIACPVENYEDYRKVVNAAADFNKVTLVFEPK